jgi:hypothetical protein
VHADLDTLVIALYVMVDDLLGPRQVPAGGPSSAMRNWSAWPSPKCCLGAARSGTGCGSPTSALGTCSRTCRPHRPTPPAAPRRTPGLPGPLRRGRAHPDLVGPTAPGGLHPCAVRGQPRDGQALGAGRACRLRLLQQPPPLLLGLPAVGAGRPDGLPVAWCLATPSWASARSSRPCWTTSAPGCVQDWSSWATRASPGVPSSNWSPATARGCWDLTAPTNRAGTAHWAASGSGSRAPSPPSKTSLGWNATAAGPWPASGPRRAAAAGPGRMHLVDLADRRS